MAVPSNSTTSSRPNLNHAEYEWLSNHLGKAIRVITVDGKQLRGVLSAYSQYNYLLLTESYGDVLLAKHYVGFLIGASREQD